jgi:hypothetical protein
MAGPAVLMAATTRLIPPEKRGMATGIVNAGGSFGQFVFAPIAGHQTAAGWAVALQSLAVVTLLALPAAWVLRGNSKALAAAPPRVGGRPRGQVLARAGRPQLPAAVRRLLRLRLPRRLPRHAPARRGGACQLPPEVGAWALGVLGLFNIVGSLAIGWAIGRGGWRLKSCCRWSTPRARGGAGVRAGAEDHRRDAGLRRGDGPDLPVDRAADRRPGGQVLRPGAHGHAVRRGDAVAPDRRLPRRLAGRQGLRGTGSYDWMWYADIVLAVGAALVHLPIRERDETNQGWTSRQVLPAGGDFCGDEKRSARVGARERAS